MLYVLFGDIKKSTMPRQYIHNIDGFFDGYFEDFWMDNSIAKRAVKEIDKSELIAPKIIESPVLRTISHEWLPGGTKQLIMCYNVPEVVYDGDNFGDNCWELLLEVSKIRDVALSLTYFPRFDWVDGTKAYIINTGEVVSDFTSFNRAHLRIPDDTVDFKDVNWYINIDYTKFELEEIDF